MSEEGILTSTASEFTQAMDEASNTNIQIQEIPQLTLVRIEVDPTSNAAKRMQQVLGVQLPQHTGDVAGDRHALEILYGTRQIVACLFVRYGVYLVVTHVDPVKLGRALNAALGNDDGLILDVSANRSVVELSGSDAAEVLSKTVTFEDVPEYFDQGMALACHVGDANMMMWRTDAQQYLMVPRSSNTAPFIVSMLDAISGLSS